MLLSIISATLLISLLSFAGVLIIPNKKEWVLEYGVSLAVGALLGAVFLNIFPEIFIDQEMIEFNSLIILISIISFFLIERFIHWHHCSCDTDNCQDCEDSHDHIGWINIFGGGLHSFIDGMIIGVSFMTSWQLGLTASIAIALHAIPQEIGNFSILIKSGFSRPKALFWNFMVAFSSVIGGILVWQFNAIMHYNTPLLSIAAGSFIYLVMADIMPSLHHSDRKHHLGQILAIIIGVVLIYLGNIAFPR